MTSETSAPAVVDLALFGELRTIQALRNSGVIPDDDAQAKLLIVKRINHGLNGDYTADVSEETKTAMTALQGDFKRKLQTTGFDQLVQDGHFNRLLDDYLTAMIGESEKKLHHLEHDPLSTKESNPSCYNECHKNAEAKRDKYKLERDYYRNVPQVIKDVAKQFQPLLESQKYLPMGKIIAQSGVVSSDVNFASDMVSDVLGVVAARNVKLLTKNFVSDEALARFAADPVANKVRIQALAENLAKSTQPLCALKDFEKETPELDRIIALKTLLSVQLHHAVTQERPIEQLAAVEQKARELVKQYTQVTMSLAGDYMDSGASAEDPRVKAIQSNLKAEMIKEGITILPMDQALAEARKLARASAEDILNAVKNDEKLTAKLSALAESAGVDIKTKPLENASQLIGVDVTEALKSILSNPNTIVRPDDTIVKFLEKEQARRNASGQSPIVAA